MSIQIGSIRLNSKVMLAPMSGVSDLPFRRRVKGYGAALVFSEMIASKAMVRAAKKTLRMSKAGAEEHPLAVQIAGNEPQIMAEAAKINQDRGVAIIDINMGCPVKKVVNDAAGCALMRDEVLAGRIMQAIVNAVDVPVTLKMRTGWDEHSRNAPKLARIAEQCGIKAVTIHGRTRAQFYHGHADWEFIKQVKDMISIPVIGNGDINTIEDAEKMLCQSGADGVMIGRGAYGRPWFLNQVSQFLDSGIRADEPPLAVKLSAVLSHYEDMLSYYGVHAGIRIARKHIGWYSKGMPGSAEFRANFMRVTDGEKAKNLIYDFYTPIIEREAA